MISAKDSTKLFESNHLLIHTLSFAKSAWCSEGEDDDGSGLLGCLCTCWVEGKLDYYYYVFFS